eukprot:jgi/Chrzof1/3155/Cz12g13250.t1
MRTMLPSVMRMYAAVLVAGLLLFMAAAPGAEATAAKVTAEATAAKATAEATAAKATWTPLPASCWWRGRYYVHNAWDGNYHCWNGNMVCVACMTGDYMRGRKMLTLTNTNGNSGPAAQVAGAA